MSNMHVGGPQSPSILGGTHSSIGGASFMQAHDNLQSNSVQSMHGPGLGHESSMGLTGPSIMTAGNHGAPHPGSRTGMSMGSMRSSQARMYGPSKYYDANGNYIAGGGSSLLGGEERSSSSMIAQMRQENAEGYNTRQMDMLRNLNYGSTIGHSAHMGEMSTG